MSGYCNECGWTVCVCEKLEKNTRTKKWTIPRTPEQRLRRIREIILGVESRCMAVDGPVTKTSEEITEKEIKEIYDLASII